MSNKMYTKLAKYYDLEYGHKNYAKESKIIHRLIKKHCKSKGKELLDVACGTGGHDIYFRKWYNVTGIDLSPNMLAIARKKVKGVRYLQGNMQTFKLGRKFDAIACLFSAFNYNITKAQILKTLKNFHSHLKTDGIVVFDLFTGKIWRKDYVTFMTYVNKDVSIARITRNSIKDSVARLIFIYYIIDEKENKRRKAYPKTAIEAKETHKIGVYDNVIYAELAKQTGFRKVIQLSNLGKKYRRPVFVLVK